MGWNLHKQTRSARRSARTRANASPTSCSPFIAHRRIVPSTDATTPLGVPPESLIADLQATIGQANRGWPAEYWTTCWSVGHRSLAPKHRQWYAAYYRVCCVYFDENRWEYLRMRTITMHYSSFYNLDYLRAKYCWRARAKRRSSTRRTTARTAAGLRRRRIRWCRSSLKLLSGECVWIDEFNPLINLPGLTTNHSAPVTDAALFRHIIE